MDAIVATSLDQLPDGAVDLLAPAPFDVSAAWFRVAARTALPSGARPFFVVAREDGRPVSVWPMLDLAGTAQSFTTPYTCHYAPALAGDARAAARAVGRVLRRWPVTRLEALDAANMAPFAPGLRDAGLLVLPYDHFGNWHEPLLDWPSYLAARPGQLRETVRRRSRALTDGRLAAQVVTEPGEIGPALAAYQEVYARSWKTPEPHPDFAAAFLHEAARAGVLRLGVLRHEGRPVAAQYWTVEGGVATVLKLAHDETLRALSPGTVLTALMIRRAIEQDGVRAVDFGRGDDDYKQLWTSHRRRRIGWLLANLVRPQGLTEAARHLAGTLRRRAMGAGVVR